VRHFPGLRFSASDLRLAGIRVLQICEAFMRSGSKS
jgi:hypothetical protein